MKDLHNHIFSNTTCISKESMLRYINKQLPKKELHQVETHMLDCELCTDAYEGLAFAKNSSMLFAIDSQIDKRVSKGGAKVPIIRNLMVAASVLVIVFGTYFTFDFFNETINKNNLAINESELEIAPVKEVAEETVLKEDVAEDISNYKETLELEAATVTKNFEPIELKKEAESQIISAPGEQSIIQNENFLEDDSEELLIADVEEYAADELEEVEMEEPVLMEEASEVTIDQIAVNKFSESETPSFESLKSKSNNLKGTKKRKKSLRTRAASSAPIAENALIIEAEQSTMTSQNIRVIEGYKTVNYIDKYQKAYDSEKEMTPESHSVSAGFENEGDKITDDKAKEGTILEITYKETLESAIRLYKNKKYRDAHVKFHFILKKHPEEVNAQFYLGLCYFYLEEYKAAIKMFDTVLKNKKTEFNEEANWYKALSLVNMKSINSAKKILNKIIEKDGFYKVKAEQKLEEL